MPPKKPASHHQRAFELFDETRNYKDVQRKLEEEGLALNYITILDWARKDFKCSWGCPYHNYAVLLEEKQKALASALRNMEKAQPTENHLAEVVSESLDTSPLATTAFPIVKGLIRSDIERIQNLEYLYAKIFFHATGIAIQYDAVKKEEDTLKALFRNGLNMKSLESAIGALSNVIKEIETIKEKAGLSKPIGAHQSDKPLGEVKLDDLRKMHALIANTPADKVRDLLSVHTMETAKPVEGVVIEQGRPRATDQTADS